MDDDMAVNTATSTARVLLIADDRSAGDPYRGALEVGGYDVKQAESFADVLGSVMPDPDVVVLYDLAMFAYPGQEALVVRIPHQMTPDELVTEVHRRIALRATLHAIQ
jgi:DNA-binding NtrC family response regulator